MDAVFYFCAWQVVLSILSLTFMDMIQLQKEVPYVGIKLVKSKFDENT